MHSFSEQCLDMARSMLGHNIDSILPDGTVLPIQGEQSRPDEPGHVAFALGEFYRATGEATLKGHDLIDLAARCITAQMFMEPAAENGLAYAALGLLAFGLSSFLLPMLAVASPPPPRTAFAILAVACTGIVLSIPGFLQAGAMLGFAAAAAHVYAMEKSLRGRLRSPMGPAFLLIRLSWACLLGSLALDGAHARLTAPELDRRGRRLGQLEEDRDRRRARVHEVGALREARLGARGVVCREELHEREGEEEAGTSHLALLLYRIACSPSVAIS